MQQEIEALLRARHDPGFPGLDKWLVVIEHRGAPDDEKVVDGSNITRVKKNGFWTGTTFIPSHRIKDLRRKATP